MHSWCPPHSRKCVFTVLLLEVRLDATNMDLPSLPHDIWLLLLEFIRRADLGRYL